MSDTAYAHFSMWSRRQRAQRHFCPHGHADPVLTATTGSAFHKGVNPAERPDFLTLHARPRESG